MHFKKSNGLNGSIKVAGDKSISHRSLIISSMAVGTTYVKGMLEGEDVLNTAKAMQSLGVPIKRHENGIWEINGVGVGGLSESNNILDMGNSGTGLRLIMGLVSPYPFNTFFCGDESLSKRPMERISIPMREMGAEVISKTGGKPPLVVIGNDETLPITYKLPVASAQVKSAILLAGLNTKGKTTVIEPKATRDHTERMLIGLGAELEIENKGGENHITITGQPELTVNNQEIEVYADPSSASFLVVAGLIVPNSHIIVKGVGINPLRAGLFTTLKEMGANLEFTNTRMIAGEEVADIEVRYSQLKGVEVPAERVPSMIDEFPILAVAASFAEGDTEMQGLAELKVKESNRLKAIYDGLVSCGVKAVMGVDYLIVTGGEVKGGAEIQTHMDHRIAMSFLIMSMASNEPVSVDDILSINTSFPEFINLCKELGALL